MIRGLLILLFVIQLLGCSRSGNELRSNLNEGAIEGLLKSASTESISTPQRIIFTDSAFKLVQNLINDSIKIKYLFKIANRYYNVEAYDQYKKASDHILKNALSLQDTTALAKVYEYNGDYYWNRVAGRDSALYYYSKSKHLYSILNNKEKVAIVELNKAILLFNSDDFYGAEIGALKSLEYFKTTSNYRKIFEGYITLGLVALELEDFHSSIRYFTTASHIVDQHLEADTERLKSLTFNNIAVAHLQAGSAEEAIGFLMTALKDSALEKDNPRLYAILLDNLAFAKSCINGDSTTIFALYSQALKIKEQLPDTSNYLFTQTRLADYFLNLHDTVNAIRLSKEVLITSTQLKDTVNTNKALKVLMLADQKNSSYYAKIYLANSDIRLKSERRAKNKFARFKFDTDQIISERESAIKQKWIVLCIALLVILLILLLYVIRAQHSKHSKLMLLQAQQTANEEIYTLILKQQDQVDAGRDIEKNRIARELHDGIMNKLASTRLNLDILNTSHNVQTITKCLPFISGIQDIEKEIRNIAHDLINETYTNKSGFKSLISNLLRDQSQIGSSNCHFQIENDLPWEAVNSHFKVHVYRILQELFHNINKHSNAKNIVLNITIANRNLLIHVSDDGIGFPSSQKSGMGLSNIKLRVATMSGKLEIKSEVNVGTSINIQLPL